MSKKRIVVGLSGGVDSSVAAALLQEQGHEVIGLFMKNWHDESVTISNECPWVEDSSDALIVAEKLGIPFQTIDLSKEYKERVVDYMFEEYRRGRTPNPDVLCNREVKFDIFLKAALKLGADMVATGHYCRKATIEVDGKPVHRLLAGKDANKDQSYFLCQLNQAQLSKALFPVGDLQKPEVREIARRYGLVTAEKKDSQGICFVGKVRLPEFLKQKLEPKIGLAVEIPADSPVYEEAAYGNGSLEALTTPVSYSQEDGEVRGEHSGAHYFTIGQRKGLNIGGSPRPLFVIATDVVNNIIYTGQGEDHPGLNRPGLTVANEEVHWLRPDQTLKVGEERQYDVRIRYRQPLEKATLHRHSDVLYVIFDNPQKGIAAGQFVAWYDGEELIGSGVIS